MDGTRFDLLTTWLTGSTRSRRGVFRLAVGGGLGLLVFGTAADEALACRKNRKPCGDGRNGNCCSGTCKRGTCRPTPGAAGCTVNGGDFCKDQDAQCPNNPNGVCVLLDSGKPFCSEEGHCQPCTANADCTFRPNGKCLKTCPTCANSNDQACLYPRA